ncbi:MAG TPA: hypothetical protein ENK57_26100 [Polyangiaceae bacterium]|nr:hypothetical protein [Polyangiaceae bacterium]
MRHVTFAATAVLLCFTAPALAHEGQSEHTHDAGTAPAPPQPMVASQDVPADTQVIDAPSDAPVDPIAPQAVAEPTPPPVDEAGYRPRTIEDNTWRRRIRDTEESQGSKFVEAKHFLFELRFGPYWPHVDDGFTNDPGPYEEFFGSKPRFYFGLEADWLPIHIPYVLSLGPAFGWGFTKSSGPARLASDFDTRVEETDTSLTTFPMHLSAVARVDGPLRDMDIPIVPYVKAGFGFAVWRSGGGTESGSGTSGGFHLAVGGSIALNAFDPQTAMAMYEDTGIRYAHLYGEWMWNDMATGLNVGTSTVVVGIGLEL